MRQHPDHGADLPHPDDRIAGLDLARGIAVLGILTMNIIVFAGPGVAVSLPSYQGTASTLDEMLFAIGWVFFDGKMRALFTILFGAGLVLFHDSAARRGHPYLSQLRRLFWLAIFGYAHFLFLWRGDILFLYAAAGAVVLPFVRFDENRLVALALAALIAGFLALLSMAAFNLSFAQLTGDAYNATVIARAQEQIAENAMGFPEQVAMRWQDKAFQPLTLLTVTLFEAIPLLFIGMALARMRLLVAGTARRLRRRAMLLVLIGAGWSGLSLAWHWATGLSLTGASLMPYYTDLPARAMMGTGYLLLICGAASQATRSAPGRWLAAAGRTAFSNYIATTVVMTALFHGWGLGLGGADLSRGQLALFVLGGWAAMLAWSAPWLSRFGTGPLEAAWHKLR